MKCNKQQKIAFGLLGLAALAFVGDRFVLGGGSAEEVAAATDTSLAVESRSPGAPMASTPATLPMAVLARHMEEVCAAEGLTAGRSADAFTPPAAWFPTQATDSDGAALSARAAELRSKHRVTAIMRSGRDQGLAVISGQTLRVGQSFQGFTVKAIRDRAVILTDGTEQVELELADSGLAGLGG